MRQPSGNAIAFRETILHGSDSRRLVRHRNNMLMSLDESNKAGYTAQDAPGMRTFHLRK